LRIAALVEHPDHVCCRYRLAAFRAAWERAGHTLGLHALPKSLAGRLRIGGDLRNADLVILQRKLLPRWQLALLRRRVRRLVFDTDDAVWLRDSFSHHPAQPRHLGRFAATVRACDAVVVGNSFLRDRAARFTEPSQVVVVPTCVEPADYPLARHEGRGVGVQLVWVGSSSTLRGLEQARPLLEAVGRANLGVGLTLVCDRFLRFGSLPVTPVVWSRTDEPAQIAAGDIGISWLPDDDWSRGKCGLKVLQYMAAGLPVIANPVGVQSEFIRHGESGLLASTPDEWAAAVRALAADPERRRRLGAAGRRHVEAEFATGIGARAWLGVFARWADSLVGKRSA